MEGVRIRKRVPRFQDTARRARDHDAEAAEHVGHGGFRRRVGGIRVTHICHRFCQSMERTHVSRPLPVLSGPPLARGHRSEGGGTFLSGPEGPPSAVRGLLAARAIVPGLFGPAPRRSSTAVDPQTLDFSVEPPLCRSWAITEEISL